MAKRTRKRGRPVVIAVSGDHHAASTLAVCPPAVPRDDGGEYRASRIQQWLWECWMDYVRQVEEAREREDARLYVVLNGDLMEGVHHRSTQLVSANDADQLACARAVFKPLMALKPDAVFVVRGTEAHAGASGSREEALARMWAGDGLPVQRDPATGMYSRWRLRMDVDGVLLDVRHHGRAGMRPWTRGSNIALLAQHIWAEHAERGRRPPDLAIRGHRHIYADSGSANRMTRVIQLPAWQVMTAHAHKVAAESIADIGGAIVTVRGGTYEVRTALYLPEEEQPWRPSA